MRRARPTPGAWAAIRNSAAIVRRCVACLPGARFGNCLSLWYHRCGVHGLVLCHHHHRQLSRDADREVTLIYCLQYTILKRALS